MTTATTPSAELARMLGELVEDGAGAPKVTIDEVARFLADRGVQMQMFRTVTSWEELDELPARTVVIDASGDVAQRTNPPPPDRPAGWHVLGLERPVPSTALDLPVTVLPQPR